MSKQTIALVVGLGETGVAATKLLKALGYRVRVTDLNNQLKDRLALLPSEGVEIEMGAHSKNFCREADFAILSPGINPIMFRRFCDRPILSEVEWASQFVKGKIIAVTGSFGKSSTVHMLEGMLKCAGFSVLRAGNSHLPLSHQVLENPNTSFWIVELSSYQLELMKNFNPWMGLLLNIMPHHLERHRTYEQYKRIKFRLFKNMKAQSLAILDSKLHSLFSLSMQKKLKNAVWVGTRKRSLRRVYEEQGSAFFCSEQGLTELFPVKSLKLPGHHNLRNAMFAASAAHYAGVSSSTIAEGLHRFGGLSHRQEIFGDFGGATWINDSKATGVDALKAALERFDGPIHWISGGRGVHEGFKALLPLVRKKVKKAYFYGTDRQKLDQIFSGVVPVIAANDLDQIIHQIAPEIEPFDKVLLSPGLQSFDQFKNFEDRGCFFKMGVSRLWHKTRLKVLT